MLRMPLLGDLIAKVEVARFARTLATLLGNGVTLLGGLSIVKETMTNTVLGCALEGVIAKLREGKGFGRPLAETNLYPRLAIQMILVGEESGRLEEMLARVADVYDREVQVGRQALPGDPGAGAHPRTGCPHRRNRSSRSCSACWA
jgi:general secretion pathway protein F